MYSKIAESPFTSEIERCKAAASPFGSEGAMMVNGGLAIAVTASSTVA
ncbi:Uncharacterised protein [Vibrio cholerae]|uniref:Uncharacterized protein n=1 Tax=Vibrio cholerae TaxID=666 RepID=A0A656AXL8_VIBCL|nr:Uncharacterised protein [Vibrio cholerae]CSC05768.1 Uncharacterised protein [Vibrio cholerae]CSC28025.1 Uncharacterised protein [Vibrio cholerae]CSC38273.1 Uncharacterised protein [Vibrio cholerae]CSD48334.1 Uncharacterised protein [Vibrio cholerae]